MNKMLNLFNINITLFNELLKIISSKYIGSDIHFVYCFKYNLILIKKVTIIDKILYLNLFL
jgi:hypothetical protein